MSARFNLSKQASTSIKGAACLLIVLHHWCSGLLGGGHGGMIIRLLTQGGGVTGVAVFFFLSSYGLARSQRVSTDSFKTFFAKRVAKVCAPLILTNLLWLAVRYNGQGPAHAALQVLNLTDLLDLATWFCNVIIVCYVIFYVSNQWKQDGLKILTNWVLVIALAAVMTVCWLQRPCYVYSLIAFPLGAMVALLQDKMTFTRLLAVLTFTSVVALAPIALAFSGYKPLVTANLYCAAIVLGLMLVVVLLRPAFHSLLMIKRLFAVIGVYSYEIYLLHAKFLTLHSDYHITVWYPVTFLLVVLPLSVLLFNIDKKISHWFLK